MPRACFRHYFYVIFFRSDLQRAIAFVLGDLGNAAYPCAMFVNKSNFFTPFYVARKPCRQRQKLLEKRLLQKVVHAPCPLCWLHKWGGL